MPETPHYDRLVGCLLGGALGDCIGATFEGSPALRAFEIPPSLRITDDTQLTLATCEAIIESQTVDPETIARQFTRWFSARRLRGLGASTFKALTELSAGGHWATAGAVGERAAGNGAAMRISPLAFVLDADLENDRRAIRDICRITHRHEEAYVGALAVVRMLQSLRKGQDLSGATLTRVTERLPDSLVRDRLAELNAGGYSIEKCASRFPATGYVVNSVPLAILAAIRSNDYLESVQQLVALGGDTDTVSSIFGQLYGAAHGVGRLPEELVNRMDDIDEIRTIATDFAVVAERFSASRTGTQP